LSADLVTLIIRTLRDLDGPGGVAADRALDRETALFGREGILDSLALVSLVVAVEQAIEDELGVSVSLADEKALSQRHSPYRTVGTLAEYAQGLVGPRG
jgi:acyl carrier protein